MAKKKESIPEITSESVTDQNTNNGQIRKVKMKISIASADWSYYPGQVLTVGTDISEHVADAWIEAGHCEEVGE